MPRSGTTLAEQIISSHNKVYGAGELSFLESAIRKNLLNGNKFNNNKIHEINYETLKKIENEYVSQTKLFDFKEKIITDKAPLNFRWIGIIKLFFLMQK